MIRYVLVLVAVLLVAAGCGSKASTLGANDQLTLSLDRLGLTSSVEKALGGGGRVALAETAEQTASDYDEMAGKVGGACHDQLTQAAKALHELHDAIGRDGSGDVQLQEYDDLPNEVQETSACDSAQS